jgi:hypothetical protein
MFQKWAGKIMAMSLQVQLGALKRLDKKACQGLHTVRK